VHGNALEEKDAIGNYSAAQYGYNKMLPVAVAVNARQQSIMFDGFEDYTMLMPAISMMMYAGAAFNYTPFVAMFSKVMNVTALNYQSFSSSIHFSRNGQYYQRLDVSQAPDSTNIVISRERSHTGYYSLKSTDTQYLNFYVDSVKPNQIQPFAALAGKRYLVNMWVSPPSGTLDSMFTLHVGSTVSRLVAKSGNIDGWYLMEGAIDLGNVQAGSLISLKVPPLTYLDDIRLFPLDANMKSFVYDPLTFRLTAQLDDNHMATLYEYDQEGLLVRVKKETSRGVMTVSESRRANQKLQ
jgi:hypothetical protein